VLNKRTDNTLFYITDPMCSWCYAFAPVLQQLRQQLPWSLELITVLGGLAPDTDKPMPVQMQQQLQATWQRIEQKVPGIQFNYDFWNSDISGVQPRRSTYPACRAVIAARTFTLPNSYIQYSELMTSAIQTAYYQQARNPSDESTLIELATEIGLEEDKFKIALKSPHTQHELEHQLSLARQLSVSSYPSLVLQIDNGYWPVNIDYHSPQSILDALQLLLAFE
jgi:putative protein-disulfide isomerase